MVDKRCLSLFTIHSPRTWHDCPLNWYVVYLRRVHTTVSQPLFIVRTIFASFSLLFLKLFADAWNWQEYCNCFLSHHWRRSSNGDVLKWYIFSIWHAMPSGRTDRIASVKLTINFTHTHTIQLFLASDISTIWYHSQRRGIIAEGWHLWFTRKTKT